MGVFVNKYLLVLVHVYNECMNKLFKEDNDSLDAFLDVIKFDEHGLLPAIIMDAVSAKVLMMGWMSEDSIASTLKTGDVYFFSRSRQKLWKKGEVSGNSFYVQSISVDCDGDCLAIKVETSTGIACHTGRESCFFRHWNGEKWIQET